MGNSKLKLFTTMKIADKIISNNYDLSYINHQDMKFLHKMYSEDYKSIVDIQLNKREEALLCLYLFLREFASSISMDDVINEKISDVYARKYKYLLTLITIIDNKIGSKALSLCDISVDNYIDSYNEVE